MWLSRSLDANPVDRLRGTATKHRQGAQMHSKRLSISFCQSALLRASPALLSIARNEERCAAENQHVGNIKRVRIIDPAAADIEVIGYGAIDHPIIGIAKRSADYRASGQQLDPARLLMGPQCQGQRENDAECRQVPAGVQGVEETKIDAFAPSHHEFQIQRPYRDSLHASVNVGERYDSAV